MLYNMVTTCWSYEKYINFRIDQLQGIHKLQSIVYIYQIDQFVIETLCYKHLKERRESLIKESYQKNIYNKINSIEIDKDNNFIHSKFI